MTADLVSFNTKYVTIGPDQVQHIEMANDIVNKFNYERKSNLLSVPEPIISHHSIPGYDGRKMSKSYNNIIPLFCTEKKLRKHIFSIKTNDKGDGVPKEFNESPITQLFELFSINQEVFDLKVDMNNGLSWKYVKERTFDLVNRDIGEARERYKELEGQEHELELECINFSRNNIRKYIKENIMDGIKHSMGI
jgi:tryptophanyl-tRNA synthetase